VEEKGKLFATTNAIYLLRDTQRSFEKHHRKYGVQM
jgi:hypothetical protein